jgi:hypothetical protein
MCSRLEAGSCYGFCTVQFTRKTLVDFEVVKLLPNLAKSKNLAWGQTFDCIS